MGFTAYKIIKEIIDQVNELIGANENSSEKMDYFDDPAIMITKNEKQSKFSDNVHTHKNITSHISPYTPLKDVPLEALPILFEVMKRRDVSRWDFSRFFGVEVGF